MQQEQQHKERQHGLGISAGDRAERCQDQHAEHVECDKRSSRLTTPATTNATTAMMIRVASQTRQRAPAFASHGDRGQ
jgi:hypothetical protein